MNRATLFASPGTLDGAYGVYIGDWREHMTVIGFDSFHDAYYWCVQTLLIDPLAGHPDWAKQQVYERPEIEAQQLALFREDD